MTSLDLSGHSGVAAIGNAKGQDIDTYFRGFGFSLGHLEAPAQKQAASAALAAAAAAVGANPPAPWASTKSALDAFIARLLDLVSAADAQGQTPLAGAVGNHQRQIANETADLDARMAPPPPPPPPPAPPAAQPGLAPPGVPGAATVPGGPYVPADAAYTPGAPQPQYGGYPPAGEAQPGAEGQQGEAPAGAEGVPGYAPAPPGYAPAPPGYAPAPPGYAPAPPGYGEAPPGYAPAPPGYAAAPAPPGYAPPPPGYAPPAPASPGASYAMPGVAPETPHADISNAPITIAVCHANGIDINQWLHTYGISLMHLEAVNEKAAASAALAMAARACGGLRQGPGTGDQPPAPWNECLGTLHGFANSLQGLIYAAHAQNQYTLEPVLQNIVNDLNTELHHLGSPFHSLFGGGGPGPGGGGTHHHHFRI